MCANCQLSACCYYGDAMFKDKPTREAGQDVRTLPTYTIPEAAEYLGIDAWTLGSWYWGDQPLLKPSGWYKGKIEGIALLSFQDLDEAYKLHLLRTKHDYPMQYLRKALADARRESKSDHPLLEHRFIVFDCLAMEKPGRGRRARKLIALGSVKPLYIPEVVETWGKRLVADSKGYTKQIFPWRYAETDETSRPVSMQPDVLSGRLVVTGTRIPVSLLLGRQRSGEDIESIAKDFHLSANKVRQALMHIDKTIPKVAR